jgi:hypothetical protein
VAATKCRNKKKERTTRLVSESEVLELQNSSLKQVIVFTCREIDNTTQQVAEGHSIL